MLQTKNLQKNAKNFVYKLQTYFAEFHIFFSKMNEAKKIQKRKQNQKFSIFCKQAKCIKNFSTKMLNFQETIFPFCCKPYVWGISVEAYQLSGILGNP